MYSLTINDVARQLYTKSTDNDEYMHCNRFPAWHELSRENKDKWLAAAKSFLDAKGQMG